jgi:erythronate-4-phosphate dehydrogenase
MKRRLKIIVDENMPLVTELLQDYADLEYYPGRLINKQVVSDADALLIRSVTKVLPEMVEGSRCQFIGTATIGTDHIAKPVIDNPNIQVVSAPGCNAQSVAEYVLSAVMYYLTSFDKSATKQSKSKLNDYKQLNVGIIGGGNTGSAVANTLRILGFNCVIYDPILHKEQSLEGQNKRSEKEQYCSWAAILDADIVSLHVPLTTTDYLPTAKLLNETNISEFKAELIINACRGGVLTSQAVIDATKTGSSTFILDVFENEPNVNPNEVEAALLCTPHVAGYSRNGKLLGSIQVIKSLCKHFELPLPKVPELNYLGIGLMTDDSNNERAQYPSSLTDLALWWRTQVYDISVDDALFRQSLAEFPLAFDQLRKNYSHREEVGFEALSDWCSAHNSD